MDTSYTITSMNYELIKELLDADFPFKTVGTSTMTPATITADTPSVVIDETVRTPTLEELIGACGGGLASIERLNTSDLGVRWYAVRSIPTTDTNTSIFSAFTPTEAVARLWLALQKK